LINPEERMATVIRKDHEKDWAASRAGTFGEILLRAGILSEADIDRVLTAQKESGRRFGETAVSLGLIQEADVRRVLARQFDHASVSPEHSSIVPSLFSAFTATGPSIEALRKLRAELQLRHFNEERKPLAVFSARATPDAGELAANLAVAFSLIGERTLLVDANLRTPRQRELFGLPEREGLSSLLAGRLPFAQAITPVPGLPHLNVVCAGVTVPNPQELLSRGTMMSLMDVAAVSFDIVIIDVAPALEYSDAQMVSARCGGALLVTKRDHTRVADIDAVKVLLAPTGAKLVGAVLTRA
jgi:protein-tyrosine kinase